MSRIGGGSFAGGGGKGQKGDPGSSITFKSSVANYASFVGKQPKGAAVEQFVFENIKKVAIFSNYDFLTTILSKGLPISSPENGRPFDNCEIREIFLDLE
jgi:hypothetical protein